MNRPELCFGGTKDFTEKGQRTPKVLINPIQARGGGGGGQGVPTGFCLTVLKQLYQ